MTLKQSDLVAMGSSVYDQPMAASRIESSYAAPAAVGNTTGGEQNLGSFDPMRVSAAAMLFAEANHRWWITGGNALDLHFNRSWRQHSDTDISVIRQEAPALVDTLAGWDIYVAAEGKLYPWDGFAPDADRSENNLWCRPNAEGPWVLDVTISDGDEHDWIYRRDRRIRQPWNEAILTGRRGIPHLAPELQLLFKSHDIRPKDQLDATKTIPLLAAEEAMRLRRYLPSTHGWRTLIR